ncbi:MAG TPA: extracellular solute-binding protein [Anaerolineae bacterium]|nr:extracellular solute-binding protein [Anaerolineae bacterium]
MTKQLYKLTLFVVLLSLLLAACQPAAAPTTTAPTAAPTKEVAAPTAEPVKPTEPPAAPPPTEPPAKAEPVDLEIWVGSAVSEAGPPPDDWVVYDIVRDKLGINLKVVLLPTAQSDADAKINAAGAANSLPDLVQVNREPWYRLVQNGLVTPVDDMLPMMPNRTKILYTDEIRNKLVTLDGKMYGLPQPGALPRTDALVIRKDWLDKLGLETPKTLEDFMTVAKAFTEQDPDGNGKKDTYGLCAYMESEGAGALSGLGKRFEWVFGAYGMNGGWDLSSTDNFQMNVRNPNFMKALEYIKSLNDAGVVDPDWPTLKKDEFRARWKQGKCGIMNENFAALSTKANYADFDKNFPDGEWVVLPPPTGPDGKSSEGVDLQNVRIYAVSQKAKDEGKTEAIAKLLEWMSSDEGYFLLGFGQEGINYKRDDKGFVTTKGIEPPENAYTHKSQQPLTQLRNMVFNNNEIELNARYVDYKTEKGRTMSPLKYLEEYRAQPWMEGTGTAIINPPPGGADFTRFYNESLVQFVLGQQPLNEQTWAEFLAGLDGLGAKDYEAQAKETLQKSGFLP